MARDGLRGEIQKRQPFELPEEEAQLNIMRTHGVLMARFVKLFRSHGISPPQYNILRILRGASGEGLPCLGIAQRMVTRVPDITRLVDRLERARLVQRCRTRVDRRVCLVRLTERGRGLLAALDEPVQAAHRENLGHLTRPELVRLSQLMQKARGGPTGRP